MGPWWMALLTLASPGGAQPPFPVPDNLVTLAGHCDLTVPAISHLRQNGLVVLPTWPQGHIQSLYHQATLAGVPAYVTSDAMLYLWYEAHRQSVMAVEKQYLCPQLKRLVAGLLDSTQQLRQAKDDGMLRENAAVLAVVQGLLAPEWEPPPDIAEAVRAEIQRVMEHNIVQFFPGDDYTQYEPRGHYADDPVLARYFRAAKYLGRHYLRVEDPVRPDDAVAETRRAALLALAMREGEGLVDPYREIYDLRAALSGPADTIGLDQTLTACNAVYGEKWGHEVVEDIEPLRQELLQDRYPTTRITNRVLYPRDVMPPKNVAVLGVHHIPDSELFQRTIDPEIPGRLLPTGLEIAAALGSEPAVEKLKPETADFPQVLQVVREFGPQMVGEGIYGEWLATLRTLFDRPEGLPAFAQGPAYDEKQINGCLTSWGHLRHNYILYGAQSYTPGGMAGGMPFVGLVEPLPEFFSQYAQMCRNLAALLGEHQVEGRAVEVLGRLADKADTFERCARDQLAGRDISWAAQDIQGFGSWLNQVFYDSPLVVADVCTDAWNNRVLHAASGPFREIVVVVQHEDQWLGAVGYVGSYYELIEPDMGRLTDAEWKSRVEAEYGAPEQPPWLALLQTPRSEEEVQMHVRLAELREVIAEADIHQAQAAVDGFVDGYRETEWAPAAVLLLAQHLLEANDYQRAAEVAAQARPLYGCDTRDKALAIIERAEWRRRWAAREAESQQHFEQALAATEPKEGLSAEEDLKRQNRRAEAYLDHAGVAEGQFAEDAKPYLERLIAQCPDSEYVPLAEIGLALDPWTTRTHGPGHRSATDELAGEVRGQLLPLAERYNDSALGLAARMAAAGLRLRTGDARGCYEEMKAVLDTDPPDPEPHPQAAERLGRERRLLDFAAEGVAEHAAHQVIGEACEAEDLDLVREVLAFTDEHGLGESGDIREWVRSAFDYMADEPDAFSAYLGARSLRGRGHDPRPTDDQVIERAVAVADRFPDSKAAAAALYFAQSFSYRQPDDVAKLQERLAAEYPDSVENVVLQVDHLTQERQYDEASALAEKLAARYPDRASFIAAPTYIQQLVGDMVDPKQDRQDEQDRLAALREPWGQWIDEAGLDDDALRECWSGPALVEVLIERLPDQALDILGQIPTGAPRNWREVALPVLRQHPDDPRGFEVYWRLASFEDLLAIVAAGPQAPHFDEAADRLVSWSDPYHGEMGATVTRCKVAAGKHRGTPAEVMAIHVLGRTYLQSERPERAAETLEEALARIEEGRPLRNRLVKLLEGARVRVAGKRQPGALEPLWERLVKSPQYDREKCEPLLDNGRLYVSAETKAGARGLVCLDASTGEYLWDRPLGSSACSVVPRGTRLYATNGAGMLFCLDAETGECLWEKEMGVSREGSSWCAETPESILVYWSQGLLCALDPEPGSTKWSDDGLYVDATPLVHRDLLFMLRKDGVLSARRVGDGSPIWEWDWRTVKPEGDEDRWRRVHVTCALDREGRPVVSAGAFGQGVLAVLDPQTGQPVWHKQVKPSHGNALRLWRAGPEIVLAVSREMLALNPSDGSVVWSMESTEGITKTAALAGNLRLVATRENLAVVDSSLGEKVATFDTINAAEGLVARAVPDGAVVYAVDGTGVRAWKIALPRH